MRGQLFPSLADAVKIGEKEESTLFGPSLCLYCFAGGKTKRDWSWLFGKQEGPALCEKCLNQLIRITGETCSLCSRPFAFTDCRYREGDRCLDCVRWENQREWKGILSKNISLYLYNDFLKEYLARFKYRGDYILARAFAGPMAKAAERLEFDLVVPIPLSESRLLERGFNQAEALARFAGLHPRNVLGRSSSEKQDKKGRQERIRMGQVFYILESETVRGRTILLVDDIYTTGTTVRMAAGVLLEQGARRVYSLTVARGWATGGSQMVTPGFHGKGSKFSATN